MDNPEDNSNLMLGVFILVGGTIGLAIMWMTVMLLSVIWRIGLIAAAVTLVITFLPNNDDDESS